MNGPPIVQFQGRIFTDFNQPPRIPNPHNHNSQMIREQGPQFQGPRFCNAPFQQPPNGNFNISRPRMPMMRPQRPQMRQHGPNNNMQRHPNHNQWRHQRPQGHGPQSFQGYPPPMNHPQGPGPVNNMPFPPSHMFPQEPAHPPQMFMEQPRMQHPPDMPPMHFNPFGGNQHQPIPPQQTHAVPHGHGGGGPLQPPPLPLPLLPPPDIHPPNLPQQNQYFNPNHQPPQQQQPHFQNVSQGGWPQPHPQEQHNQAHNSWDSATQNFMSRHGGQVQNSAPPPNGSYILSQEQRISDVILALQQCRDRNREQKSEQKSSYEQERYSHDYSVSKSHSHEEHSRNSREDYEKSSRDRDRRDYDTYDDRDRDGRHPRSQDRYNSKRKYDQDYYSGSNEKVRFSMYLVLIL
jgi:hypothetical protein